mgnify:FL=1|jgi:hypothetical protein
MSIETCTTYRKLSPVIDIPKSSLTNQGETKMQDEVTLEELLEFSQDMAENFPDDSVDLNSENM